MIVRDVMTRKVACGQAGASIEAAIALMLERRISGLPVLDREGSITGIVTEGDLLRRPELGTAPPKPGWIPFVVDPDRLAQTYAREHGRRVSDVMTRTLVTVSPDATLAERQPRRCPGCGWSATGSPASTLLRTTPLPPTDDGPGGVST